MIVEHRFDGYSVMGICLGRIILTPESDADMEILNDLYSPLDFTYSPLDYNKWVKNKQGKKTLVIKVFDYNAKKIRIRRGVI